MFETIRDPGDKMRAVTAFASQVTIDESIPAKRYFRSGKEMLRMANIYCDEKNYEAAYILYAKFITLFVERLPKHCDYKSVPPAMINENKQKLNDVFPVAEILKKKLKTRYMEQEIAKIEQEKKDAAALAKRQEEERIAEEKRQAEEERRRREEEERANDMMAIYGPEMIKEQEEHFRKLQEEERKRKEKAASKQQPPPTLPATPSAPAVSDQDVAGPSEGPASVELDANGFPVVPPPTYDSVAPPRVPSRDLKPAGAAMLTPSVDRSTKPQHHFMSTGSTTNNNFNLKTVLVPAELMVKFLNLAQSNTSKGIETGGFLFGKLKQGQFRITYLIIPEQLGKSDSFIDESDEDELFTIQDKYDVTQLGWIHTHPTQTAFLSSVDQHVQASFQCMLPESIAIVCAPKFQETGIYYLTPDFGLDFVVTCTGTGFHPHPSTPPVFEACSHAHIDSSGSITVVDLRKRNR